MHFTGLDSFFLLNSERQESDLLAAYSVGYFCKHQQPCEKKLKHALANLISNVFDVCVKTD